MVTNRRYTVIALLCATFLAAMEATAVATVMPTIVGDLGGIHLYAWVFTAYMMSSTVSFPIYGKLADLYGRKPVLTFGISLFLMGSILSAMSKDMNQLILFRAMQGLGAGAIQPMGLTITGDIFKIEERAKITGVFGAVWGLAGISGPIIGGMIVQHLSWHWIFYVNLPFGIASLIILYFSFHEKVQKKKKVHLDILGAIALTTSILLTLLALQDLTKLIFFAPAIAIVFYLFLLIEKKSPEPMLPLQIFSSRIIIISSIIGTLLGAGMMSTVTYLPLFIQGVMNLSATEAGMVIIPMGVGWPLASSFSARLLRRLGFRKLVRIGLTMFVASSFFITYLVYFKASYVFLMAGMLILGMGMGLTNTPLLISVQTSVSWAHRGISTASIMFFRTIGGTMAVALMGTILVHALKENESIPISVANHLLGPEHGKGLDPETVKILGNSLAGAIHFIFLFVCGIAIIGFFMGLLYPNHKPKAED